MLFANVVFANEKNGVSVNMEIKRAIDLDKVTTFRIFVLFLILTLFLLSDIFLYKKTVSQKEFK